MGGGGGEGTPIKWNSPTSTHTYLKNHCLRDRAESFSYQEGATPDCLNPPWVTNFLVGSRTRRGTTDSTRDVTDVISLIRVHTARNLGWC